MLTPKIKRFFYLSLFLVCFFTELILLHSHIDHKDFLNKLKTVTASSKALLVTLDVQNMYPSIPTVPGVKTVTDAFQENPQTGRPDDEIVHLLKLCLENNDFEFGENI